jgi:hypothetical protein
MSTAAPTVVPAPAGVRPPPGSARRSIGIPAPGAAVSQALAVHRSDEAYS